jgi:hypothetical protein
MEFTPQSVFPYTIGNPPSTSGTIFTYDEDELSSDQSMSCVVVNLLPEQVMSPFTSMVDFNSMGRPSSLSGSPSPSTSIKFTSLWDIITWNNYADAESQSPSAPRRPSDPQKTDVRSNLLKVQILSSSAEDETAADLYHLLLTFSDSRSLKLFVNDVTAMNERTAGGGRASEDNDEEQDDFDEFDDEEPFHDVRVVKNATSHSRRRPSMRSLSRIP